MNTAPDTARAPDAPPAAPDVEAPHGRTRELAASAAAWLGRFANWPSARWPVPTATALFALALLVVAAVELLPKSLSDITLTVQARTEVLELTLQPERTYLWWLPAGEYSLLSRVNAPGCVNHGALDTSCTFPEASAVTIAGGAVARFEVEPADDAGAARFSMTITPHETGSSRFELAAGAAKISTSELITFAGSATANWRIPLIVERVQIGDFLTESLAGQGSLGTARQPIMMEGEVRMFARSLGFTDRYQVQEERFDAADVIQIPADSAAKGLLLGLLSLPAAGTVFDVTLHTDVPEVYVRRLGAEHRIGVSTWSVISKLPLWLALWVVWAALLTLSNYHSARLSRVRG